MMQVAILVDKWDLSSQLPYWIREWWKIIEKHAPTGPDTDAVSWLGMVSMLKLNDMKDKMIRLGETGHDRDSI